MLIFPAIDLLDQCAVRLFKGDYAQKTVYSTDPVSIARDFAAAGSSQIHLVDLEGARSGGTPHLDLITRIKREVGLFCEVGGGIRSMDVIRRYLDVGVDRVILGTAAVTDPDLISSACAAYGNRIAVGVDIRDGNVSIKGWMQDSGMEAFAFCETMQKAGVSNIICTDISRDGAMRGTNLELYRNLSKRFSLDITASGGVSSMDDVKQLAAMNLYGAIIGKAYYTGAISLAEAIEVSR